MSTMQWTSKMQRAARCCPRGGALNNIHADAGICRCAEQSPSRGQVVMGNKMISAFPELAEYRAAGWEGLQPLCQLGLGSPCPPQCLHETVAVKDPGGSRSRHSVLRDHDFPRLRWGSSAYSLWGSQVHLCAICERLWKGAWDWSQGHENKQWLLSKAMMWNGKQWFLPLEAVEDRNMPSKGNWVE